MSKRNSSATSNTLFNYFTKTPPSNKKPKVDNERQEKNNTNEKNKKRERELTESPEYKPLSDHESDDEEEIPKVSKKKRIRLYPVDSDESDSENRADNQVKIAISTKSLESFKASPRSSREETTVPAPSIKKPPSTPKSKPVEEDTAVSGDGNWLHLKLDFLKPEHIRDKMKRRPEHPDYDSRTLFVPDDFMKEQTPAHRQWWDMKSSHYDCVLFFKVGKFYELYHMDAAVGVNELGFSYMKGEFAHSGFPESAYARMASSLVAKGYKVARVEQTETPDMMQERCRKTGKSTKWDKVVQREICQVTCQGTEVCGLQDFGPRADQPAYMMAIVEERGNNSTSKYGICFVDTSTGSIHLGQFTDDIHSSRLMITLAHYPPALIIYERRTTSPKTLHIINSQSGKLRKECINQLWSAERTLKFLADRYYMTGDGENRWPDGLKKFISQGDVLGLTPAQDSELIIKALGGCVSYLKDCLLDIQVLTMSQFHSYTPVNCRDVSQHVGDQWNGPEHMILDAITLRNLRIVGESGSLYDRLNFCCTAMGKRLLHQWLCTPCCDIVRIRERQDAVRHLMENNEVGEQVRTMLKQLPDLERLLAKLHALGNLRRSKDHPDGRAIFYEEKTYTKRNVKDFISVVNGFESILYMVKMFDDCESVLLRRLTQLAPDGGFPDYSKNLEFFKGAFDPVEAEREGRILPRPGVDTEYDECLEQIAEIEGKLEDYRREQEKYFKCKIQYVGTDKKRYQLEIPESASKKADDDYQLEGSRKGFKRFSTFETKELLGDMQAAEQSRVNILLDLSRRMMERFTSTFSVWDQAVRTVAHMDVLCSLAEYGRLLSLSCFPEVMSPEDKGVFLDITDGCHPCIPVADEFIPNDTRLGVDVPTFVLLSGPNMGGKSTLMRQVGLITVMAHIGSPVPAEACSMSLCSRVFTRVGARDDLISGQSTFLVEMSEAATILTHADHHSLVLIDELGRGTSTYDGTAIAWSVMLSLSKLKCRTIFSTHYHRLSQKAVHLNNIRLMHMGCMVETEEKQSGEVSEEMITFLYKLSNGACPKSYGFNAARLAGLSANVITRAQGLALELQQRAENLRALRDIMKSDKIEELRAIVKNITV